MVEHTLDEQLYQSSVNDDNTVNMTISHAALLADMEQVFTEARPRLLRLAHLNGMSPDSADDVVQETMMEAWRHIEHLRNPQSFHAWLDGICRNVCRRHKMHNTALFGHESLSSFANDDAIDTESDALLDIPDPLAIDPAEELSKQDLATLLDRAMGNLAPDTRKLLEMCYLAELPQREAAMRLGLTIGALELRLYRARKQLRQVLNGALRADAESFGLALDPVQAQGWRETRQWCWLCGKHRMIGIFEQQPDGHVDMRLRCPECSDRYDFDISNSCGMAPMEGLSSFRPAIKRLLRIISERILLPLTEGVCWQCRRPALISIVHSSELNLNVPPNRYWVQTYCQTCGTSASDLITICTAHPLIQHFFEQHERFISEPCQILEQDGTPIISTRFIDITSAAQLTVFIDAQTFHILTVF